jgi:hypothetical protein
MIDLKKFIRTTYDEDSTTLRESIHNGSKIKIFKSTQVDAQNTDDTLKYREISISKTKDPLEITTKNSANPISLKNQKLEEGDIIIPMRKKLDHVLLLSQNHITSSTPTVVSKWAIIIRTGDINLGYFIKDYLEKKEVIDYIDSYSISVNGRRSITQDIIYDMPFPNIINYDFSMFATNKKFYGDIDSKRFKILHNFNKVRNEQLRQVYKKGLNKEEAYNLEIWNDIDKHFDSILANFEKLTNK